MIPSQLCSRCPLSPVVAATRGALDEIRSTAAKLGVQALPAPAPASPESVLSPREYDILLRLAGGLDAEKIGRELFISAATVKTHVQRLYKKLGVHDRAHAVHVAWQRGYLGKDEAAA